MNARPRVLVAADPAFRELCEQFRALEARKASDEASVGFARARLVRELRVRLRVPVATLCEALDLSAQSIHTYRTVAERITPELCRALAEERRADGGPLFPWSILVQLSRLARPEEREAAIELIRLHGWRTRDVQRYVSALRGGPGRRGRAPAGARQGAFVPTLLDGGAGDPQERRAPAAGVLLDLADGWARGIAEAALALARGGAPARELREARAALGRCAEAILEARGAIERRLPEGDQPAGSPESRGGP